MTHLDFSFLPRLDTAVQDPESDVLTIPEIDAPDKGSGAYRVILYNDEWHGMDEVVEQVMKACECDERRAVEITLEAHLRGRTVCLKSGRSKCHKAARILREIRLQCEVDCDD